MKFHQNHVCFRVAHALEHVEFSSSVICKNFSEQGCKSETAESFTCVNELVHLGLQEILKKLKIPVTTVIGMKPVFHRRITPVFGA